MKRIVVIGASAGGVLALEDVVADLPQTLAAALLVVLHVSPTQKSLLAQILSKTGPLPAHDAIDREPLQAGRIYVARPDRHLMVERDHVRITRGPKENHWRPSIDVLFRSAARDFGVRAVGVILSGALSDGSSGLFAIKRLGGIAVIQEPTEAAYSSMPLSALRRVEVDYTLPAREIGDLLAHLLDEPLPPEPADAALYRGELEGR